MISRRSLLRLIGMAPVAAVVPPLPARRLEDLPYSLDSRVWTANASRVYYVALTKPVVWPIPYISSFQDWIARKP